MKVSLVFVALVALASAPTSNAFLHHIKKMLVLFYPHSGWDSWSWWDVFHKSDKVCNKLTQDYVDCGGTCRCGKSFDIHRGGFGYRYSCILPRESTNTFCIATNCGNYQITRTIFPHGVNVEECAVPGLWSRPDHHGWHHQLDDPSTAAQVEESFLWHGWDDKWDKKEEKYDHWEDKFNDKLDNWDHWNSPTEAAPTVPPPPFGRTCATYMTDVKEVVDCEYEINAQVCQTCGIGRYGPTADCSNVLGFTDFTGFSVAPVDMTPMEGGSVTVDEEI